MKAAAYARVSTELGQDPELQLTTIRDAAANRGLDLVVEYSDVISGTKSSRPALDRLIKDARMGKFKVIVVTGLDRLGRNTLHALNLIQELESYGVRLISLREAIDFTTPAGRAMLTQLLAFAQLERDLIAERVRTAIAAKKVQAERAGKKWKHGRPVAATEAQACRARELAAKGASIREIVKEVGLSRGTVHRLTKNS
jgi:DNA invertase Pin-like site-specific DNA recombinase